MEKIFSSALPTIILLTIVWSILGVSILFIRYQLNKEKNELDILEKKKLYKEIDDLGVYVSKLPRTRDILKEFNKDDKDII